MGDNVTAPTRRVSPTQFPCPRDVGDIKLPNTRRSPPLPSFKGREGNINLTNKRLFPGFVGEVEGDEEGKEERGPREGEMS